jgi:ATP/ADP translocase
VRRRDDDQWRSLCVGGLLGAVLGNMNVRNIGIVGYAFVLPVVMLLMGQLFAATPAVDDRSVSRTAAQ